MLNLLSVALQGLAPAFKLSPISIAVQGLIAQLQEERRDEVRGGRGVARTASDLDPLRHQQQARRDDVSVEDVLAKWELLELQQRRDARPMDGDAAPVQRAGEAPAVPVAQQQAAESPAAAATISATPAHPPALQPADPEEEILALLIAAASA